MLANKAPLPCIAHWDQEHFVVVHDVQRSRRGTYTVCVADPGKELLTYTQEEFCQHWLSTRTGGEDKGVVLLLEPAQELHPPEGMAEVAPVGKRRVRFLWGYIRRYRRYFLHLIA